MPYLPILADWVQQSTLLLQARPTTTRITSKYTLLQASPSASKKRKRDTAKNAESKPQDAEAAAAAGPRAELKLKTYDPASGACLMYRTEQAAEVARLARGLGRLARDMAGLPELIEDSTALEVPVPERGTGTHTPVGEGVVKDGKAGGGEGGGGKKKKKKGKK